MYIEMVRDIIVNAVGLHAKNSGKPVENVLAEIAAHIENTSREHRKDEPAIQYGDPLCRLGYLYMHAAANATLFEKVIWQSPAVMSKLRAARAEAFTICSLGGGPGTELLGLAKYLLRTNDGWHPSLMNFTVVDNVKQWSDTWSLLGNAVHAELRSSLTHPDGAVPAVAPMFLPFDALDASSYAELENLLHSADLVVMNYLLSENKARLGKAQPAISELARLVSDDCVVVVIDRLEHDNTFTGNVTSIFDKAFGGIAGHNTLAGTLDRDEQTSDMGEMLISTLRRTPRVKFFTDMYRDPTVFWFTASRS